MEQRSIDKLLPRGITPLQAEIEETLGLAAGTLTREKLADWQLQRINQTVAHCLENSPFYHEKIGFIKDHLPIRSLTEFTNVPLTTQVELAQNALQLLCCSQSEIARVVTLNTSGTISRSKRLFFTAAEMQQTVRYFQTGMSTLLAPGWQCLILFPHQRPHSIGSLLKTAVTNLGAIPVPLGMFENPMPVNQLIQEKQIETLVGAPKQIYTLMKNWTQLRLGHCPVRTILLSSDYAAPALRQAIERGWDCQVLDHYGMTECGYGAGIECSAKDGFHLREADFYYEVVDPSGQPAAAGDWGEVVITTLRRDGMPLIRCRTGDVSRFVDEPCACGTVLRRLDGIPERVDSLELSLSIPRLDQLLFQFPCVNGYDAYQEEGRFGLELYLDESSSARTLNEVRDSLAQSIQTTDPIVITVKSGFPHSAFSLAKKRVQFKSAEIR